MIAMIFEFWMTPGDDVFADYSATSGELRTLLSDVAAKRNQSAAEHAQWLRANPAGRNYQTTALVILATLRFGMTVRFTAQSA